MKLFPALGALVTLLVLPAAAQETDATKEVAIRKTSAGEMVAEFCEQVQGSTFDTDTGLGLKPAELGPRGLVSQWTDGWRGRRS